jgi:hypothetical protein
MDLDECLMMPWHENVIGLLNLRVCKSATISKFKAKAFFCSLTLGVQAVLAMLLRNAHLLSCAVAKS